MQHKCSTACAKHCAGTMEVKEQREGKVTTKRSQFATGLSRRGKKDHIGLSLASYRILGRKYSENFSPVRVPLAEERMESGHTWHKSLKWGDTYIYISFFF
jgi:hypothetical protein